MPTAKNSWSESKDLSLAGKGYIDWLMGGAGDRIRIHDLVLGTQDIRSDPQALNPP